jgi:predicted HicB family RNase H-like nuclease
MLEGDKEKRLSEEEREQLQEKLDEIKEELKEQLEDISEEIDDINQELQDEREEIIEDLEDALEDLKEEEEEMLHDGVGLNEVLEYVDTLRNEIIAGIQTRIEKYKAKVSKVVNKVSEKARRRMESAEKKAAKRINISVEPELSEDWKNWAEGLGTSVSELVRKSMDFVKTNIGDLKKLEKMEEYFEKMGGDIENALRESGIKDIGKNLKAKITVDTNSGSKIDKEAIKKRIQGIIKLHNAIPIDKLALALNKSVADAEKLIYELAGEGLDGTLEGRIFKYTGDMENVISKFNEKIDQM